MWLIIRDSTAPMPAVALPRLLSDALHRMPIAYSRRDNSSSNEAVSIRARVRARVQRVHYLPAKAPPITLTDSTPIMQLVISAIQSMNLHNLDRTPFYCSSGPNAALMRPGLASTTPLPHSSHSLQVGSHLPLQHRNSFCVSALSHQSSFYSSQGYSSLSCGAPDPFTFSHPHRMHFDELPSEVRFIYFLSVFFSLLFISR